MSSERGSAAYSAPFDLPPERADARRKNHRRFPVESFSNPSKIVQQLRHHLVRSAFADENPAAVDAFLAHYAESVDFVNENVADAAQLVGDYDIVPAQVAEKALPECNIVCVTGEDMKERLSGYLAVLADQNPEAVGGAVPDDDFYYGA